MLINLYIPISLSKIYYTQDIILWSTTLITAHPSGNALTIGLQMSLRCLYFLHALCNMIINNFDFYMGVNVPFITLWYLVICVIFLFSWFDLSETYNFTSIFKGSLSFLLHIHFLLVLCIMLLSYYLSNFYWCILVMNLFKFAFKSVLKLN